MASKKKDEEGTDRTGMVLDDLTEEQIAERAEELAQKCTAHKELKKKKRTHVAKWNEELRQLEDDVAELAEAVELGKAWVPAQAQLAITKDAPKPKRDRKGQGAGFAKKAKAAAAAPQAGA